MATLKISDLTATTTPAAADVLELEITASPASRKCTLENLFDNIAASTTKRGSIKKMPAIADLALTVSNPPTQAEVQAVANKVDALLAALRTAGALS